MKYNWLSLCYQYKPDCWHGGNGFIVEFEVCNVLLCRLIFLESMMNLLQRTVVGWIIPVQCALQLEFGTMNLRKCSIPFFAALFPPFNIRKCSIILHKCSNLYHFLQHYCYFSISVNVHIFSVKVQFNFHLNFCKTLFKILDWGLIFPSLTDCWELIAPPGGQI